MAKLKITLEDMLKVLQRKGYVLEQQREWVVDKKGKGRYIEQLYALIPGRIYGLGKTYRPENTAETVFSNIVSNKQASTTTQDFLDSL